MRHVHGRLREGIYSNQSFHVRASHSRSLRRCCFREQPQVYTRFGVGYQCQPTLPVDKP